MRCKLCGAQHKDGAWWCKSWNPVTGCGPPSFSPACRNCWARNMVKRFPKLHGGALGNAYTFDQVVFHHGRLEQPLHWRKPRRIFVCSLGDLFHEKVNIYGPEMREIFRIMASTDHAYFLLTKRPKRMADAINALYGPDFAEILPNVWCGVTVEHADYLWRIEELLQIPAARRFVSIEPMLSDIYLDDTCGKTHCWRADLDLVVAGCESGPGRRHSDIEWFRNLRDQCVEVGTPFYLKQLDVDGKLVKTPTLDGRQWLEMPE